MSVTYTPAAERALGHSRTGWRLDWRDALLPAASVFAVVAIMLAHAGALHSFPPGSAVPGAPVVNLNTVPDAASLEPALEQVFAAPADRATAAREIFRFVLSERERAPLPNVGALVRARTSSAAPRPGAPLLSAADLALVKPRLAVRTSQEFSRQVLLYGFVYVIGFHLVLAAWRLRGARHDPVILVAVHLLTAIGFAALLARPDPFRDTFLIGRYVEGILVGLSIMTAVSVIDFRALIALELSYLPLIAAVSLSIVLLFFGSGPRGSGAKVNLGPVQPIEAIRLLLALFLAGYFARRWELLRSVRETAIRNVRIPEWIDMPRLEYLLPVAGGIGIALCFFVLQKDLGPALFACCVFVSVYAVARARTGMVITGLAALAGAFYVGHALQVSQTLADRVSMWRQPWNNTVVGGDQIAQSLWALASGGLSGTGLGQGDSRYLPAGHTDLILAAVGEELGAIGLLIVGGLYALLAARGFRTGRLAHNDYGFFVATTMTLFLIVPVCIMASGVVGAAPLTGVVTPFLSYGGSAMVTNFAALGILASIHADRRSPLDYRPFRAPMRWLTRALAGVAALLAVVALDIQVVRGDHFVAKPYVGVQADGGKRFAYNPRVLDLVREIPRGSVFDRRGLPLATDDAAVAARAREPYRSLGVLVPDSCGAGDQRCYPLGPQAFHLLGDVRTRANWSAANTSYVERDAESTLRGFDDRATVVDGLLRRDYSEIVPLLRGGPENAGEFLKRPRDVRLTVDAGLQHRTAAIVASYASRSGGRAAAIVVDAETGALLASVSYPMPLAAAFGSPGHPDADPFLDRARYGLYPPGSTFKLVTAAAALRQNSGLHRTVFTCTRLPDGRVGAKLPGWGRPVRDDVLNAHPHGSIDLHHGLVRSCNGYFAQLAVTLGPEVLLAAAGDLGIALTRASDVYPRVRDTLPQIGYGQGDVVATPLRMARVAAAIASDGRLRDVHWDAAAPAAKPAVFLEPEAARRLGRYMRDTVLAGRLREHPLRIAGKTGTAEVAGKPSHSWFVGFAPYGTATKRIAFAVVIENAGYGSAIAAPAAGEIVSAAVAAGLLK